ncbi:hypothetical protein BD410DRAFT_712972 [Rickenella mellea]|uniref:F-box domain-containing protein n=1 Tax=Rickenella mellea TaxID=50990 RepID=A0A4Y7QLV4_9AGAM|nr:hypothetical protein BD410DRAFT_712972 [Rickenella mellea]
MPLENLPSELYSTILDTLPAPELQKVTLALTRAIPRAPVPLHHLFTDIRLQSSKRIIQLHRRLRDSDTKDSQWVKTLSIEAWDADPHVAINLLDILQDLESLTVYIGPTFAPEHLSDMFLDARPHVRYLSLRFRPYVQRATYYQFLKGAYFDSALSCLSKWPNSTLRSLSVIQDPLDESATRNNRFAQPLVFFSLEPFTALAGASCVARITSLRVRVPSRNISPFICAPLHPFPGLELLDMSTCNVKAADVETLLASFTKLRHIILDGCSLLRGESRDGEWHSLGKAFALAGVRRAKDKERKIKEWLSSLATDERIVGRGVEAQNQAEILPFEPALRNPRRGRKGVANSTISLRASRIRPMTQPASSDIPVPTTSPEAMNSKTKIRVLPPWPSLRSFSTTVLAHALAHPQMQAEFSSGWAAGISQLAATYARLRTSRANGVRVLRFTDHGTTQNELAVLHDLTDADDILSVSGGHDNMPTKYPGPVLCFGGPSRDCAHVENCGHVAAFAIWDDAIN